MGFGAMRLTGPGIWGEPPDREQARTLLRRAVDLGVNFIDTADTYGPNVSEEIIREALHPYPDDLVINGKGGRTRPGAPPPPWGNDGRPEHLVAACEGSLRRLGLEQFPIYLLHHPDEMVPIEDSVGALAELKQQGKIRHIGVSNVNEDQLRRAQTVTPIVAVQNRYTLDIRSADAIVDLCEQEDMVFMPFAMIRDPRSPAVTEAANRHGVTPQQVVLAWLLARSPKMLPIPGTSSTAHLEENIRAATIELTPTEVAAITAAGSPN